MAFPLNHKTVFVLDHSPVFAMGCTQVEFDFHKSKSMSYTPTPPINKTIWTCATEAVLEYCRIVWDIFPDGKCIRFVFSGQKSSFVNNWDKEDQTTANLIGGFARVGRPISEMRNKKGFDITYSLQDGLDLLSELTDVQKKVKANMSEAGLQLTNGGRIICLTFIRDKKHIEEILKKFQDHLRALNESAASSDDDKHVINNVELDILHCDPVSIKSEVMQVDPTSYGPLIKYQVIPVQAGTMLSRKLLHLALCHYQLASTTVTGIPMKEEQNASTSANYDVELFHKEISHTQLLGEGFPDLIQTSKQGNEYRTVTLKWCTPRGSTADLHHSTEVARVTPTDVNSRPSSCLTNFLLSGRSVMLELPRKGGAKVLSHMLTSHGGEIFIHTLFTGRSILEDPPSITEGPGGRVSDYRTSDLVQIIKANRLAPYFSRNASDMAAVRLERFTRFAPMTVSTTTIFNMAVLEPLQKLIVQEELSDSDLAECRKIIYMLISMENKGEILPVPIQTTSSGKTKTLKKEEQYKMMYKELEKFLTCHARTERHYKVLECLMDVRNTPMAERPAKGKFSDFEAEMGFKEIDRYSKMTEREKSDFSMSNDGVLRSTVESPMSPSAISQPPSKKFKSVFSSGMSVLDIVTQKIEKENSRKHVPFHGLRSLGDKAKLYLSMERTAKEPEMNGNN